MSKRNLGVDFDGVIHRYSKGWGDGTIYDEPMPGVFEALLKLMHKDYNIVVFTARPADDVNAWLIEKWPFKMFPCPVAQNTKPQAVAYIDDRAVKFTNWADMVKMFTYKDHNCMNCADPDCKHEHCTECLKRAKRNETNRRNRLEISPTDSEA